jgi:uncharacterized membrane protein (DUF2068 family)
MNITPEQIELGEAVSRLVMSWLAFVATFATTAAFLGLLVWSIYKHDDWAAKVTLGVVNGFLLSLLHIIFRSVFSQKSTEKKNPKFSAKTTI